jgi:hypothetical protein
MSEREDGYYTEADNRPFFKALVYERDGDLNLSWLLLLLYSLTGIASVIWTVIIKPASVAIQIASLSFMGSAFIALLIASIPYAKAKLLAKSNVPSDVAKAISSAGLRNVETSTDLMELRQITKINDIEEIG